MEKHFTSLNNGKEMILLNMVDCKHIFIAFDFYKNALYIKF